MVLVRLSKTFPLRQSEWMLALVTFSLGLLYALSPGLFSQPYFVTMLRVWPQEVWATLLIVTGLMRLIFLAINGALRASPHIRCLGAVVATLVWLQLTFCAAENAAANSFVGQTMAIWPCFLLFDAFSAFAAARDARASDDRARSPRDEVAADGTAAH